MTSKQTGKNRYKFVFGDKPLTLTTEKDNLFMEEVEHLAQEKYEDIKQKLPSADGETIAILMAINSLSMQLEREVAYDTLKAENEELRQKLLANPKETDGE
ncbi:cell division protein ZapA [Streptococcus hyointestinalis]|uniref:cell division protein ZapA n=1 Tax=Streptococcus hyointestinalis TaxID=1337 RepID=UPI0013E0E9EF|nr:cell division protein ZapA [Streptococcus hyointestinalis]